jgi:hypothetical protein
MPAIDPAISIRPVKSQLIAKVSSVPSVRQLIALRIDLACVSAPRNNTATSQLADLLTYHARPGGSFWALSIRQWTGRRKYVHVAPSEMSQSR